MRKNIRISRPVRDTNQPLTAPANMLVADIVIRNVDRSMKDVQSWRNALQNASSVYYPNRVRLYDLYDDVLLDGHLSGLITRRISAVRNKRFRFVNAEGKKMAELDPFISSRTFRDVITKIMEAQAWGISGMEFDLFADEPTFIEIPRKHIKPEFGVIAKEQHQYTGYYYPDIQNIFVVGDPRDYGYLLKCCFYALIKKGNFSDWAQFVEIFGQPIRVAKYDAYDLKTKQQLKAALDEAGSSLAMLIPKQAEFDMIDGKASNANGDLQKALKDSCNDEMSMVVLTNTETSTGANGGSLAKAKEQGKQQLEVTKDDLDYTLIWLNSPRFINILAQYGLPVQGGRFEVEKEVDMNMLSQKVLIDVQVANRVPIADEYWYETYAIPKPDNYDELKRAMEEARQAAQQSPQEPNEDEENAAASTNTKRKAKPAKTTENAELSAWDKLRMKLADFFDPAP
jgi:hypothetical protein